MQSNTPVNLLKLYQVDPLLVSPHDGSVHGNGSGKNYVVGIVRTAIFKWFYWLNKVIYYLSKFSS